jgi:predicted acyl esterase
MAVIRPKVPADAKVPVIVQASVYFHALQTMDMRACEPFLTENYIQHGYAVAFLAVRGTADSGGCMNLMGPEERGDIDQAITWLGRADWSNGSVGMVGLSYDGATQWEAASFRNPYLKTIVPISGVPDIYELLYGRGRIDWRGPAVLNDIYYAESAVFYAPGRSPQHTAEVLACPEYATGNAASLYSSTVGGVDPFGYWAERRYRKAIGKRYDGSVFLVQGLQDWNVNPGQQFPWVWKLDRNGLDVKYMLGQWGHAWPHSGGDRMDWADILKAWFDRYLKDDRSARFGPRVQVQDDTGKWRNASRWPDGRSLRFFLNPEHALEQERSKETASETIATDPFHMQGGYTTSAPQENAACAPSTCTYFETRAFEEEFRIAGVPRVGLTLTPTGPSGQVSVYLYAASDAGMDRLGWGQLDLRFAKSTTQPGTLTPNEEMKVTFDLQPLDAVVEKGERLYVVVSGGTGWNRIPTGPPSLPIQLAEGKGQSRLDLVHVRPQSSDFFQPAG